MPTDSVDVLTSSYRPEVEEDALEEAHTCDLSQRTKPELYILHPVRHESKVENVHSKKILIILVSDTLRWRATQTFAPSSARLNNELPLTFRRRFEKASRHFSRRL